MGAHSQEELGVAAVHGPVEDDESVRLVPRQEGRKEVPLAPGHNLNRIGEDGGGLGLTHHSDVPQGQNLLQEGHGKSTTQEGALVLLNINGQATPPLSMWKNLRDLPQVEHVNTFSKLKLTLP
jgi:hypothetical protein